MRSTFSSAFEKHSPWMSYGIGIQLCIQHHTHFEIKVGDIHSALHSTLYTHWISRYGIDIRLCSRKCSSWISSCESRKENPQKLTPVSSRSHPRYLVGRRTARKDSIIDITSDSQVNSNFPYRWSPASLTFNNYFYLFLCEFDIQLYIQHQTHFEYRTMGSTFRSAFKNINLEYRAVGSIFSSAFNTIHTLDIELLVHSSVLHSKPLKISISSYELDIQHCIRN